MSPWTLHARQSVGSDIHRSFDRKPSYSDAGLLEHSLEGLKVSGLSGIEGASQTSDRIPPENRPWSEIVALVRQNRLSKRALSYYRQRDFQEVLSVGACDLLLTHDNRHMLGIPIPGRKSSRERSPSLEDFQAKPFLMRVWAPIRSIGLARTTVKPSIRWLSKVICESCSTSKVIS